MVLPFFVWNIVPKYMCYVRIWKLNSTMFVEVSGYEI